MNSLERNLKSFENEIIQKLEHADYMLKNVPQGELRMKMHRGKIHYYNRTIENGKTCYTYIRDCEKDFIRSLAENLP